MFTNCKQWKICSAMSLHLFYIEKFSLLGTLLEEKTFFSLQNVKRERERGGMFRTIRSSLRGIS